MEVGLRRYVVATNAGTVAVVLRALLGELLCLQPRGHHPTRDCTGRAGGRSR